MPRGGYRPGAGRKHKLLPALDPTLMPDEGTPLAYMLRVIYDDAADPVRRDRMAIAAAPYFHGGAVKPLGKKAQAKLDAEGAGVGTSWEDILQPQPTPKRPPEAN